MAYPEKLAPHHLRLLRDMEAAAGFAQLTEEDKSLYYGSKWFGVDGETGEYKPHALKTLQTIAVKLLPDLSPGPVLQ